jgi:hypothetical protein
MSNHPGGKPPAGGLFSVICYNTSWMFGQSLCLCVMRPVMSFNVKPPRRQTASWRFAASWRRIAIAQCAMAILQYCHCALAQLTYWATIG